MKHGFGRLARYCSLGALSVVGILSIVVSGGGAGVTTSLSPTVITMGKIASGGILPANCNDWISPWSTPQQWWNSLSPGQSPKAVGEAAVGFDLLFDTRPGGGCTKFRQDLYRTGFTYDFTQAPSLKGPATKAELTFTSAILPSGVSSTGMCQPVTGGGGSLWILQPGSMLPAATSGFADLGSGPAAQPYPTASKLFGMMSPWIAGPITTGVPPGVTVTTIAGGGGTASFTVDVVSYLNAALGRSDTSLSFMLSGVDEATLTTFPAGPIDCKTVYKVGSLVVQHQ
jgi:hypothetical protein